MLNALLTHFISNPRLECGTGRHLDLLETHAARSMFLFSLSPRANFMPCECLGPQGSNAASLMLHPTSSSICNRQSARRILYLVNSSCCPCLIGRCDFFTCRSSVYRTTMDLSWTGCQEPRTLGNNLPEWTPPRVHLFFSQRSIPGCLGQWNSHYLITPYSEFC